MKQKISSQQQRSKCYLNEKWSLQRRKIYTRISLSWPDLFPADLPGDKRDLSSSLLLKMTSFELTAKGREAYLSPGGCINGPRWLTRALQVYVNKERDAPERKWSKSICLHSDSWVGVTAHIYMYVNTFIFFLSYFLIMYEFIKLLIYSNVFLFL